MKPRMSPGKVVLVSLVASVACVALAITAAILSWPRLLVPLFGLEERGSLAAAMPADPGALRLEGLADLDRVEFLLPPYVNEPVTLVAADLGNSSFAGEQATPGISNYRLVLDQAATNRIVRQWLANQPQESSAVRDVWIDLQPGALILFAEVNLGVRWQRAGLLFVYDGDRLLPTRLVLGDESFALPESGFLARKLAGAAVQPNRALEGLVLTGPLPGDARVVDLRLHPDHVEIHAQATFPAPPSPDTGWQTLEPGIELREMDIGTQFGTARATIVRLDPEVVRFRVGYDPANPRRLSDWASETEPVLAVNGGFFTPENQAIGVVVSAGQRAGSTLGGFAGMFAVSPEEKVSVRWLASWPYDPNEPLLEAVQSFPMLVRPGGVMGFPADGDDGTPDRRTAIGQDRSGRILVMVMPNGLLSLHEVSDFLASADLDLEVALNLDGGSSTGIWLDAGGREVKINSGSPLPVVILAERR